MVVRKERRSRKYFGSRHWGLGNIKNGRGSGDRGGVGKGAVKPRWTWTTAKHPELIGKRGFHHWGQEEHKWIDLYAINGMLEKEKKETLDLKGYKVLSRGELNFKVKIKASGFSKKAMEKIKAAESTAEVV